jgi:hypothetical protein
MTSTRQQALARAVEPVWAPAAQWIDVRFETAAQLADSLVRDRVPFELAVPGSFTRIGVGERVPASVEVRGFEPLTVHGMLVWRRIGRRPGMVPAVGLRLDSDSGKAVLDLQRVAASRGGDDVGYEVGQRT